MATNLEFIKSVIPDGSSSSVSITNVFSAKYDAYAVTYNFVSDSGSPKDINLRFINASDSIVTDSNYDYAYLDSGTSGHTEQKNTNQDNLTGILGAVDFTPEGSAGIIYAYNPFSSSLYTFVYNQAGNRHNGSTNGWKGVGVLKQATSMTGLNIYLSSTNFTSGSKITVYGVV